MRVAIGVTTCQRPSGLSRLIESLDGLTFDGPPLDIRIVVVDNDAEGSARAICQELKARVRWPLAYDIEPQRGIPFGRNKVIACAGDDIDFLAFLDDDETVESDWLDTLMRVLREYSADVVTGPSLPRFQTDPPDWLANSKFFDAPGYTTGAELDHAYTNNVLISKSVLAKMGRPFDERLALTGADDLHFFKRVRRAGFRIIWAADAIAHEHVPASRMTRRWVLARGYRNGNSHGLICRDLNGWSVESVRFLGRAVWIALRASILLPIGFILRRPGVFKHLRQVCNGTGMLVGWLKIQYKEYKHIHGH